MARVAIREPDGTISYVEVPDFTPTKSPLFPSAEEDVLRAQGQPESVVRSPSPVQTPSPVPSIKPSTVAVARPTTVPGTVSKARVEPEGQSLYDKFKRVRKSIDRLTGKAKYDELNKRLVEGDISQEEAAQILTDSFSANPGVKAANFVSNAIEVADEDSRKLDVLPGAKQYKPFQEMDDALAAADVRLREAAAQDGTSVGETIGTEVFSILRPRGSISAALFLIDGQFLVSKSTVAGKTVIRAVGPTKDAVVRSAQKVDELLAKIPGGQRIPGFSDSAYGLIDKPSSTTIRLYRGGGIDEPTSRFWTTDIKEAEYYAKYGEGQGTSGARVIKVIDILVDSPEGQALLRDANKFVRNKSTVPNDLQGASGTLHRVYKGDLPGEVSTLKSVQGETLGTLERAQKELIQDTSRYQAAQGTALQDVVIIPSQRGALYLDAPERIVGFGTQGGRRVQVMERPQIDLSSVQIHQIGSIAYRQTQVDDAFKILNRSFPTGIRTSRGPTGGVEVIHKQGSSIPIFYKKESASEALLQDLSAGKLKIDDLSGILNEDARLRLVNQLAEFRKLNPDSPIRIPVLFLPEDKNVAPDNFEVGTILITPDEDLPRITQMEMEPAKTPSEFPTPRPTTIEEEISMPRQFGEPEQEPAPVTVSTPYEEPEQKTAIAELVKTGPKPGRPLGEPPSSKPTVKPPTKLRVPPTDEELQKLQSVEEDERRARGVTWQQGKVWVAIYPPFTQDDIRYALSAPSLAAKVKSPKAAWQKIKLQGYEIDAETLDEWATWFTPKTDVDLDVDITQLPGVEITLADTEEHPFATALA